MKRIVLLTFAALTLVAFLRAEDFSKYKTADDLWDYVHNVAGGSKPADSATYIQRLEDLRSALLAIETRFPDDPRRWDAKLMQVQIESTLAQLNNREPDKVAIARVTKEIISA